MHERPGTVLGLLEHREVDDEQERPGAGLDEVQPLGDLVAGRAQQLLRRPAGARPGEDAHPGPPAAGLPPASAPSAATRPPLAASEMFLAAGPPRVPSSPTVT